VGDPLEPFDRLAVVAAAIVGAGLGSKLLVWLQHPDLLQRFDTRALLAGKSVAGALIGGLVLVECVKRWIGVRRSTGDLYVLPLCLGIALGRVGCFLSGLDDHTFGTATSLPWGVDFGDGVRRHPTQLYEIALLIPAAFWAARRLRAGVMDGSIFRGFLIAYLAFRIALDFVKPEPRPYAGLTATQIVGTLVMAYLAWMTHRSRAARAADAPSAAGAARPLAETAGGR
jgi:phosphatidylglycerol---prolipoprotein diacylglyceryl transferase